MFAAGLLWAKWLPHTAKTASLADTGTWDGGPIFTTAGSTPSLSGAVDFTVAYFRAVWKAALVGLVVAAALEAFVPKDRLARLLTRRTRWGQGVAGGLLSMPSMMCTCCTSPVAVGLRRRGAPVGATVAYWLGNPLLNPAVLIFLALTLPWPYAAVRAAVGAAVVLAAAVVAARVAGPAPDVEAAAGPAPRFSRILLLYALMLVPEYLVLVFATGWLSGWLANWAGLGDAGGPLALLLIGLVGAALVIPTGGEIPVVVGLVAAGASLGTAGVLLITLPALSVPSIVMVARAFSWRVTAAVTGLVVAGGVVAGALLAAA
ncbi:permease [Cryptosporangium japonicum]|uniref:Permease n=1 Tax=Cryptosporangium japonicum TaxID=80872 RepID=A0ABN0U161_9ACTN